MLFCEHKNLQNLCYICHPKKKSISVLDDVICPIFSNKSIPQEICNDAGCILVEKKSGIETYECTDCGWIFTNFSTNYPKWVICDCGNTEVRKTKSWDDQPKWCLQCSSKRYKCAVCKKIGANCTCQAD